MTIKAQLAELTEVVDAWRESPEPTTSWRGNEHKQCLSQGLTQGFDELATALEATNFPEDEWEIVLGADLFISQYESWNTRYSIRPDMVDPAGTVEMWGAWENLQRLRQPRPTKMVEPIEDLIAQGLSQRQIAKIYGWQKSDGTWDEGAVQAARRDPAYDPRKPEFDESKLHSPAEREHMQIVEDRWDERTARISKQVEERIHEETRIAPESIHDLVQLASMSVKQIKKILPDVTDAEIQEACEAAGVRLNDQQWATSTRPASAAERLRQQEAEEAKAAKKHREIQKKAIDSDPPADDEDLILRMVALSDEGFSATDISKIIGEQGVTMAPSNVGKKIAEARREMKKAKV